MCSSTQDSFRHMDVTIFLGRTDNVLCQVAAVLAYLAIRPQAPGPLFVFKASQESAWWLIFAWACVKLNWRQIGIAVTVLGLDYCSSSWSRRFVHQNAGTVGVCCLSALCPHPKRPTSSRFISSSLYAVVLKLSV